VILTAGMERTQRDTNPVHAAVVVLAAHNRVVPVLAGNAALVGNAALANIERNFAARPDRNKTQEHRVAQSHEVDVRGVMARQIEAGLRQSVMLDDRMDDGADTGGAM
jgi:hypothetical protein